jgi:calcineurin-like phosphoesterase family protein
MNPPKTWLITDTHFNHSMLVNKGHRPANFQDQIITNWKKMVRPADMVFHLGDVILGKNGTLGEIMEDLPGTKVLIRGNHDHESNAWYTRHGFLFVAQGILHGGVWLSHIPADVLPSGAVLNVHGHLHNSAHHGTDFPAHCKLLSIEHTDYKPVGFDEFVGFTPIRRMLIGE